MTVADVRRRVTPSAARALPVGDLERTASLALVRGVTAPAVPSP